MKKIIFILLLLLAFCFNPVTTYASSFNQTYVRLNSLNANSALSGTICADPSSAGAGTESKVLITFPSDFTINTTASNWTTSLTNLPVGATAWPSIGATATSVSGKTVTFSSADLTSSTLYCFNFTGSLSTTGSSGADKSGTITTKNSSDTTIDSTNYAIGIVSSGSINITATVDPQVSDLSVAIASTTTGSNFPQDTTLNYTLTYGSLATTSIPLTIQAEWTKGTIGSNPSPSVDILDYVVGSATDAYGSTSPVIDTVNRTITWTISSFPASTVNKTVNFSLKTNSAYTGSSSVSFDILARATSGSTTTPDKSVTQTYLYSSSTLTPTPTSATSATLTPTPTPIITTPLISDISIRNLTQSEAQIYVETNNKSIININYGTSLKDLSTTIKTAIYKTQNLITISDLKPDTNYYFTITATDENGNKKTSDIFTFKTAYTSDVLKADLKTLIATSNDVILLSPITNNEITPQPTKNIIVVSTSTVFTIKFALAKNVPLKVAQLIVRDKNVLGFSTTETADASSNNVDLVEVEPGVYVGKLKATPTPGEYEIYVRLIDFNGNITEQKISDLIVARSFTILDKDTNKPIENVRVLLYLYNQREKIYELISPQSLPIKNPSFSNPDGTLDLVLIKGKYKAEISNLNYKTKTVVFEINQEGGYPLVKLTRQPFNIINYINYYSLTIFDGISIIQRDLFLYTQSSRLFNLMTLLSLFGFVLITLLSFLAKTRISILDLPYFLIYKTRLIFLKDKSLIIQGRVRDEADVDISKVIVSVFDTSNNLLFRTKTNQLGEFYFKKPNIENFKVVVSKDGFIENSIQFSKESSNIIRLTIKRTSGQIYTIQEVILLRGERFVGFLFELLLFISLVVEVFFIFTFGFLKIAPFLIVSTANMIILFLFLFDTIKEEVEIEAGLLNKSEIKK